MFTKPLFLVALASALGTALAWPFRHGHLDYTFSTLTTIPGTQTLENHAIRENGDILVTSVSNNTLYLVSPHNPSPVVSVVDFPVLGLLGIAELGRDVFYVIGSDISGVEVAPGTNKVWKVDLTAFKSSNGAVIQPPAVSLVAKFPDAGTLNGMTVLDQHHLLLSDSQLGRVVKLDVRTGQYSTFSNDPTMAPLSTDDGNLGIGINGIHIWGRKLYFTSLDQGLFASIDLDCPTDPAEIIVRDLDVADDFAFTNGGRTALIANNGPFTLTEVDISRESSRLINSTALQRASAVALSKGPGKVLYVTGAESTIGNETVGRLAIGVPKH